MQQKKDAYKIMLTLLIVRSALFVPFVFFVVNCQVSGDLAYLAHEACHCLPKRETPGLAGR